MDELRELVNELDIELSTTKIALDDAKKSSLDNLKRARGLEEMIATLNKEHDNRISSLNQDHEAQISELESVS